MGHGPVKRQPNSRIHSSAALRSTPIWSTAIGYDPYKGDSERDKLQRDQFQNSVALMALAKLNRENCEMATIGTCRKCGADGHLSNQCFNAIRRGSVPAPPRPMIPADVSSTSSDSSDSDDSEADEPHADQDTSTRVNKAMTAGTAWDNLREAGRPTAAVAADAAAADAAAADGEQTDSSASKRPSRKRRRSEKKDRDKKSKKKKGKKEKRAKSKRKKEGKKRKSAE